MAAIVPSAPISISTSSKISIFPHPVVNPEAQSVLFRRSMLYSGSAMRRYSLRHTRMQIYQ